MFRTLVVVVVTLCVQGGPFSYEAGIQRGPVTLHPALHKQDLNVGPSYKKDTPCSNELYI